MSALWIGIKFLFKREKQKGKKGRIEKARSWSVGTGRNVQFNKIQDAVNQANPGDTILIGPGTYCESIKIDKDLTLRGDGRAETIVHYGGKGAVITIKSGSVNVEALTITGSGSNAKDAGIRIEGSSLVMIKACNINGNRDGVDVRDTAQVELLSCSIGNNRRTGIELKDSCHAKITGCTFREKGGGITLLDDAEAEIKDCDMGGGEENISGCGIALSTGCGIALMRNAGGRSPIVLSMEMKLVSTSSTVLGRRLLIALAEIIFMALASKWVMPRQKSLIALSKAIYWAVSISQTARGQQSQTAWFKRVRGAMEFGFGAVLW